MPTSAEPFNWPITLNLPDGGDDDDNGNGQGKKIEEVRRD